MCEFCGCGLPLMPVGIREERPPQDKEEQGVEVLSQSGEQAKAPEK